MVDLDTAIALDERIEKLEAELAEARARGIAIAGKWREVQADLAEARAWADTMLRKIEVLEAQIAAKDAALPFAWAWRPVGRTDWEGWTFTKVRPTWLEHEGFTVVPLFAAPARETE